MPTFLVQFSYTAEGTRGLLKEGGTKRREAVEKLITSLGGKLKEFYYCFGEYDGIAVIEGKDLVSQAAASLIITSTGLVNLKSTLLLSPEEMDQATKVTAPYRPPGQ